MKHVILVAALLMTSALAHAGQEAKMNGSDPNLSNQKTCWKRHATQGDTSQAQLIHANSLVTPEQKFNSRSHAPSVT
jgi:hypothetical protein